MYFQLMGIELAQEYGGIGASPMATIITIEELSKGTCTIK